MHMKVGDDRMFDLAYDPAAEAPVPEQSPFDVDAVYAEFSDCVRAAFLDVGLPLERASEELRADVAETHELWNELHAPRWTRLGSLEWHYRPVARKRARTSHGARSSRDGANSSSGPAPS